MTELVSITRKADGLRDQIVAAFSESGSATVLLADITVSADEWRKLARSVARALGRPVETVATDTRVWAVLKDWPANDDEQARMDAAMRAAMDAMGVGVGLRLVPSPGGSSPT